MSAPPTPLATPGRLRELRASGQLQQQWAHQADEYVRQAEHHAAHAHGGRWAAGSHARDAAVVVETGVVAAAAAAAAAGAGADLGAAAAKRMHGEEEITLMLPPEVHKRLKGQRPAAQPAAPL